MSTETADTPPTPPPALHLNFRRGTVFMLLSLACFTTNSLLLNHFSAQRHIDPWVSMTFRFAIGLVITFGLFAPSGSLKIGRCFTGWLMASRGVLGALGTAAYYCSVGPLGAGKATLIGNTWCVFAAILAALTLGEKLSTRKVLGIAVVFGGLSLLTKISPWTLSEAGQGEVIALTGAVLAAAVVVVIRQLTRTETSATIFASQCVYGLMLAAPLAVWHFGSLVPHDYVLLAIAALAAGFGQLAMTEGFRFLSVTAGSAFQRTLPLIVALGGVVFFAEHFTALQIVGGVLILAGSYQVVVKSGK